jgi:hypothetical protein
MPPCLFLPARPQYATSGTAPCCWAGRRYNPTMLVVSSAQRGHENPSRRTVRVSAVSGSCCDRSMSWSIGSHKIHMRRDRLSKAVDLCSLQHQRRSHTGNSLLKMDRQSAMPLVSLFCDIHDRVRTHDDSGVVNINGHSLDVAGVVAVARLAGTIVSFALDLT